MSRTSQLSFGTLAVLSILWLAYALLPSSHPTVAFKTTHINNPDFAEAWPVSAGVVDHHGKTRQLSEFKGKVVLLFFGYTQCPDVCPTALYRATMVMQQLGEDAEKVQVLFMTLDPQRDTVALLNQYIPAFDQRFLGLRPNLESVPALAATFKVFYRINPGSTPDTYTLDHGVTTYAYDPAGKLRLAISHGASVEEVTSDIRTLLSL
jgi:protein SCO1